MAGPQKHLNVHGDNLGNVVQFMQREHPDRFQGILDRIADKIPGIGHIAPRRVQMDDCCSVSATGDSQIRSMRSRCRTAR